ncbi:MAG: hypothetical protein QW112_02720 [Candidatus Micrarchaeia archaeon]
MELSPGPILGIINLTLAISALCLLYMNRMKIAPKQRIILDFASVSIICAVFWGLIGGTFRHVGLLDLQTAVLISELLATLYLIFTFLAVLYFIRYLAEKERQKTKIRRK